MSRQQHDTASALVPAPVVPLVPDASPVPLPMPPRTDIARARSEDVSDQATQLGPVADTNRAAQPEGAPKFTFHGEVIVAAQLESAAVRIQKKFRQRRIQKVAVRQAEERSAKEKSKRQRRSRRRSLCVACALLVIVGLAALAVRVVGRSELVHLATCGSDSDAGFADAYVLANCTERSHCGTYRRATSRCDCVPTYRMNATNSDAARVLYRGSNEDDSSVWIVGEDARANDCGLAAADYTLGLSTGVGSRLQASTLYYLMSGNSRIRATPDVGYGGWREVSAVFGNVPASPDFAVTASDGGDLCRGVDCGDGGNCATGQCVCTGLHVGSHCADECACSGRGEQTALQAARATGRCADGSCTCSAGSTGLFCELEDAGR